MITNTISDDYKVLNSPLTALKDHFLISYLSIYCVSFIFNYFLFFRMVMIYFSLSLTGWDNISFRIKSPNDHGIRIYGIIREKTIFNNLSMFSRMVSPTRRSTDLLWFDSSALFAIWNIDLPRIYLDRYFE